MKSIKFICSLVALVVISNNSFAQKDTAFTRYKNLPLKANRMFDLKTSEGTWTSVDISPDGKTILFDMMGDLYSMPAGGGKATQITRGLAFDQHPRYSPDGKKILFVSDKSGAENLWYIDTEKRYCTADQRSESKFSFGCMDPRRKLYYFFQGKKNQ